MNENTKAFLGTGLKFPIQVDKATGRMKMVSYEEDIQEAVKIILMTKKGERVRNPEFGCDIQKYVFDSINVMTLSQMQRCVVEALENWEPRITDIDVNIQQAADDGGRLDINIDYVVRSTNDPYSLVFPYYINEGFTQPD